MAHFVSLIRGVPDPDLDALEALYLSPEGIGRVGLWGFIDTATNTVCTVKASDGSGRIKSAEKKGSRVLVFDLAGVSDGTTIQAFSGSKPFTEPLPVMRRGSRSLGGENTQLLLSGEPPNVCQIGGKPVDVLPLAAGFGNYLHFPQMSEIHGLAVHITAGGNESLQSLKSGFESGKSTHFAIDRQGRIAQYIAASFQSQGQGDGNSNWLGVEIVGKAVGQKAQVMTDKQLETLANLWHWVFSTFPRPTWNLAAPYTGDKQLGILTKHYQKMAKEFEDRGYSKPGAATINECVASCGLSCHYWVANHIKPCPGAGIMSQMPQVLGWEQVRIAGDEAFMMG